jgi:oligopeptide transport system substrate-binding protein
MGEMRNGTYTLLLACGASIALWSCSGGGDAGPESLSSHEPRTLLRGIGPEPDSLDPQRARTVESQLVLRDLCEGLTSLDKTGAPAPGVASSWSVSTDGKTYKFSLRPEARWSNGDPVVGEDFVAGLRRLVDPATASGYAEVVDAIVNASDIVTGRKPPQSLGVVSPDQRTVVIELNRPSGYFLGLLSHPSTCPVHRATLARYGDRFMRPENMVSNGAFVLREWVQNGSLLAVRNRFYWNNAATQLDAVKYYPIGDDNAELTRYRAGQLDITATVPRGQYEWIRGHLAAELHVRPILETYFYGFDVRRSPFDKPELRRALSLVIDRERLAQLVLRVGELPAYGWVPPGVHNYESQSFDYKGMPLSDRTAEARRLYAQAGYSAARPLQVELVYNQGEVHTKLAVAIAAAWKDSLGAEVTLRTEDMKVLLHDIDTGQVALFRSSWNGDYNDAYTFLQFLKSDFGVNQPHYQSAEYDAALARGAQSVDEASRRAGFEEAERIALRDHALIPLYFYVSKHLVKPEVGGWYDNTMNVTYSKDLSIRERAH